MDLICFNGFQKEGIERDAGNNIAAYLPFHWIGFVCVYRFCIDEGFKGCVRQYQEEHCNIATFGKILETRTIKVTGLLSKWMVRWSIFFGEKWPCSLLQINNLIQALIYGLGYNL